MIIAEVKEKVSNINPILDHLLSNPKFVEMAKIMGCYNNCMPVRINGEIKRVSNFEYNVNPHTYEWQFGFDLTDWEGEYNEVIDVDTSVFE